MLLHLVSQSIDFKAVYEIARAHGMNKSKTRIKQFKYNIMKKRFTQ